MRQNQDWRTIGLNLRRHESGESGGEGERSLSPLLPHTTRGFASLSDLARHDASESLPCIHYPPVVCVFVCVRRARERGEERGGEGGRRPA